MLTWILGYFLSLPRRVSPHLECGHALALSSRSVVALSGIPTRGSKDVCFSTSLSQEAFPRGFPTGLSHVHTWWVSILSLNVKGVQGKQVPLELPDTSGGLLEWWHDPGVPLAFPVESASA